MWIAMPSDSLLGKTVLLLLICVSAAAFGWRLRRVLRIVFAAKPDPDFSLSPVGPRLQRFAAEVLLQSKVIVERPLAGIAHAFVFWGFCVFALITLNHIADGFGHPLLSPS